MFLQKGQLRDSQKSRSKNRDSQKVGLNNRKIMEKFSEKDYR